MKKLTFNKIRLENTYFSIFSKPITNNIDNDPVNIFNIYEWIKEGYKETTLQLRSLTDKTKMSDYKKDNFHYVTFSGLFSTRRDDCLIKHSDLICIDIDGLPEEKFGRIKTFIKADPHLIMCFVSPSGNGIKVIYPINIQIATHDEWYTSYMEHVAESCYIESNYIDSSCRNVSRACFISHDPEVFLNPEIENGGKIYPIDLSDKKNFQISDEPYETYSSADFGLSREINFDDVNAENNFLALIKITEKKQGPYQSPREPWILRLACRCNLLGMNKDKCLSYVLKYFELHSESIRPDKPINVKTDLVHPVIDAYKRYSENFGKWVDKPVVEDFNTKSFQPDMFKNLPAYLKTLCDQFEDREKDVFFMGLLGTLSSCFVNVSGIYDGSTIHSNLFVFVTAPPSAGKGNMKWAQSLVKPIHNALRTSSAEKLKRYNQQLEAWKDDKSLMHPGDKPKLKSLIIPGNISSSSILQTISDNEGIGLIFETEADTLSGALAHDWGNFSDLLRKTFHHETISYKRKTGDEFLEVDNPAFSVVLSGTPLQVNNLIPNTENGLFSRFCFYSFNNDSKFKNVWEKKASGSLEEFFTTQSNLLFEYYNWLKDKPNIQFKLTDEQENRFLEAFTKYHDEFRLLFGEDMIASVRRLGIITFRIAMIITIFRKLEEGVIMDFIICNNVDFDSALTIVDVLIDHTAHVYQKLNKNGVVDLKPKPLAYFKLLPNSFNKKQAITIGESIGIIPKTAENYLDKFIIKHFLTRLEHNSYAKIIS